MTHNLKGQWPNWKFPTFLFESNCLHNSRDKIKIPLMLTLLNCPKSHPGIVFEVNGKPNDIWLRIQNSGTIPFWKKKKTNKLVKGFSAISDKKHYSDLCSCGFCLNILFFFFSLSFYFTAALNAVQWSINSRLCGGKKDDAKSKEKCLYNKSFLIFHLIYKYL